MKWSCILYKRFGFTLAEVLITIGIIGVVASITIPTLYQNSQYSGYIAHAQKMYASIENATNTYKVENGIVYNADMFNPSETSDVVLNKLLSQMLVSKNCGVAVNKGCWGAYARYNNTSYQYSPTDTGAGSNFDKSSSYAKALLADGSTIAYHQYSSDSACSYDYIAYKKDASGNFIDTDGNGTLDDADRVPMNTNVCGDIYFDVNGARKPNVMGVDVFVMRATNTKWTHMCGAANGCLKTVLLDNKIAYYNADGSVLKKVPN